jgi:hypothetical protein
VVFRLTGVDADITGFEVSVDAGESFVPAAVTADGRGAYLLNIDLSSYDGAAEGIAVVRVTDAAGNKDSAEGTVAITYPEEPAFPLEIQAESFAIFDTTAALTQVRDAAHPETSLPLVRDANGDNLWDGFTGTGYIDMGGNTGDAVQFTVDAPSAGSYTLAFRYANGGGGAPQRQQHGRRDAAVRRHQRGTAGTKSFRVPPASSSSSASSSPGSVSIFGLRPPPGRRTRRVSRAFSLRNSARPRPIVLRATPVASDTAATPPRPAAWASVAANSRRALVDIGRKRLKARLDSDDVDHPGRPDLIRRLNQTIPTASRPLARIQQTPSPKGATRSHRHEPPIHLFRFRPLY